MTKAKRILLASMIIISSIVTAPVSGFSVSGAIFEAEVAPGQSISHNMTVSIDESDPPMNLLAEVVGFGQTLDGGNIELSPMADTSPCSARSFLSVDPTSFHLDPGESQNVLLDGIVPFDIGSGGSSFKDHQSDARVGQTN